mgnify:CR=1 FL=1
MHFTAFLKPFTLLFILFLYTAVVAQKKPLDHSVYDDWKSLRSISISDDGRFVGAIISPQEGDSTLFLRDLHNNRSLTVTGVRNYTLSPDGKYTVGLIKAPFTERREARIKKKKRDEMPEDSLVIIRNSNFAIEKIAGAKSFKSAEKSFSHIAYTITQKPDTTAEKNKSTKPKELLVIRNLISQHEDPIPNAKEYLFSKFDNSLAAIIKPDKKDSTDRDGVLFYDLKKNLSSRISNEKAEYKSLAFDEEGKQLIYLATRDTSEIEQKVFDIRYFRQGDDSAVIIADKNTAGLPEIFQKRETDNPGSGTTTGSQRYHYSRFRNSLTRYMALERSFDTTSTIGGIEKQAETHLYGNNPSRPAGPVYPYRQREDAFLYYFR